MTEPLLMVVDDQVTMAGFVSDVAEDLGFTVQIKTSAKEFQAAYAVTKPLAVIMDIVMPDIDGNELLQWLADHDSNTPVVIMSGFDGKYVELTKMLAEERGAIIIATLVKPFSIDELETVLKEILSSLE
ncbi:MAG: response regulator [Immundisolibacteraceae bacterium]|nr:response regulator [Immundisolibacteraceae bacterium]